MIKKIAQMIYGWFDMYTTLKDTSYFYLIIFSIQNALIYRIIGVGEDKNISMVSN